MSISEKANDLLNNFCGAQFDYVVWSTQDNLVARDKARQEISDYIAELEKALNIDTDLTIAGLRKELRDATARIAELEAYIDQLIEVGNGMKSFLTPYVDGFRDSYPATSAWESLVKDWKEREKNG